MGDVEQGDGAEQDGAQQGIKPFMMRISDGTALTGAINKDGDADWDWARIPVALALKTSRDGLLLKRNMD